MIQPGISAFVTHVVSDNDTAAVLGSGSLPVLGTPRLAAWMEEAACACLAGRIDRSPDGGDVTSVGVELRLQHLAATPVGLTVTVTATVTAVDDRRVSFAVEATDGVDTIGKAAHERVLVFADRFMQKLTVRKGRPQ